MSVGLVLEGGGMRGAYTAGVLEAFADHKIAFPYVIGVSAGALNATAFVSGQPGRTRRVLVDYCQDPRLLSVQNMMITGSLFGYDFIFNQIAAEHALIDYDGLHRSPVTMLTGATDCATGKEVWYGKEHIGPGRTDVLAASCSVPFVSKVVEYEGRPLLDGACVCPIPVEKSMEDGNALNVIVLTKHFSHEKKIGYPLGMIKSVYGRFPKAGGGPFPFQRDLQRTGTAVPQVGGGGQAVVIQPPASLMVSTYEKDPRVLNDLADRGYADGRGKTQRGPGAPVPGRLILSFFAGGVQIEPGVPVHTNRIPPPFARGERKTHRQNRRVKRKWGRNIGMAAKL